MKKLRLCLIVLLSAGTAMAARPDPSRLPDSAKLIYAVSLYETDLGNLVTELTKNGDEYKVQTVTRAQGLAAILLGGSLHEECEFSVSDSLEVKPRHYAIEKDGRGSYTHSAEFLWSKMMVRYEDGKTLSIPPAGYVIDNCTVPFAFVAADRITLKKYPYIHILGGETMRHYEDIKVSRETIEVPAGKFDTVRIDQQRVGSPDKTLSIWVAPDKQNIAIKIVERRKFRVTSMELAISEGV